MEIPERPTSGVANCHAEGVYSFMFEGGLRMFACLNWTPLAANDYGDAVGFHDHHVDLTIKVAFGELENITPRFTHLNTGTAPYRHWQWHSALRGGRGRFVRGDGCATFLKVREVQTLTQGSSSLRLRSTDYHTVKQCSKKVGWFVLESGIDRPGPSGNYSRNDLTNWHDTGEYYQPLEGDHLLEMWNEVRGLAINAKKRSRN